MSDLKRTCCKRCGSTTFAKRFRVYCGPECFHEARKVFWREKAESEAGRRRTAAYYQSERGRRTARAYLSKPETRYRHKLLQVAATEAAERCVSKREVLLGWGVDPGRVREPGRERLEVMSSEAGGVKANGSAF